MKNFTIDIEYAAGEDLHIQMVSYSYEEKRQLYFLPELEFKWQGIEWNLEPKYREPHGAINAGMNPIAELIMWPTRWENIKWRCIIEWQCCKHYWSSVWRHRRSLYSYLGWQPKWRHRFHISWWHFTYFKTMYPIIAVEICPELCLVHGQLRPNENPYIDFGYLTPSQLYLKERVEEWLKQPLVSYGETPDEIADDALWHNERRLITRNWINEQEKNQREIIYLYSLDT